MSGFSAFRLCKPPVVKLVFVLIIGIPHQTGFGQSQNEAAVLRGEEFLQGAGSYNLASAQATSINVDTVIRWKQDLRRIEAERCDILARKEAGKSASRR